MGIYIMDKIYSDDDLKKLVVLIPDMHIWQKHKDLPQFRESRSRIAILIGRYKTRYNLAYDEWVIFYAYDTLSPEDRERELTYQVHLYDEKIAKLCHKLRDNFVRELGKLDRESLETRVNDLVNQHFTSKSFAKQWQIMVNRK